MIVRKSAWHYRVQAYSGEALRRDWEPPRDLCRYFWRLLAAPVLCLAALLARASRRGPFGPEEPWIPLFVFWSCTWWAGASMAVMARSWIPDPQGNWAFFAHVFLFLVPVVLLLVGAGIAVCLGIMGLALIGAWCVNKIRPPRGEDDARDSLLIARVRAWKAGLCPLIEYRDVAAGKRTGP